MFFFQSKVIYTYILSQYEIQKYKIFFQLNVFLFKKEKKTNLAA